MFAGLNLTRSNFYNSMPRSKPPGFCSQHIARKLMIFASCFAILINVPYCFMYKYNDRGDLVTTNFFHSR